MSHINSRQNWKASLHNCGLPGFLRKHMGYSRWLLRIVDLGPVYLQRIDRTGGKLDFLNGLP